MATKGEYVYKVSADFFVVKMGVSLVFVLSLWIVGFPKGVELHGHRI